MATEQTRTSLIGLSVVMLGSAPGTDLLNEWVDAINDGMTEEDIANHIAASDAFTSTYPTFLTNEEFATSFLENLMGSEEVPAALVTAAVGIVTGLLNDGMTRGALSLAVIGAMYDIHSQGEAHAAYGDLGAVANGLFNKIEVAEYYTLDALLESPSSSVLDSVNSDMDTVTVAIEAIDGLETAGQTGDTFNLSALRDSIGGTPGDDHIYAEPVLLGTGATSQSLQSYDAIDGAGGQDTLFIYDIVPAGENGEGGLRVSTDQVSNVENVVINAEGGVTADMTEWSGLESVLLERFGGNIDVAVDGASVTFEESVGEDDDVMVDGAGGPLSLSAHRTSNVEIVTRGHTTSVDVTGGMDIGIDGNGRGGYSESLTSVTASQFANFGWASDGDDLRVNSDALESITLSTSFGAATVNYETLTELAVNVAAFGGKHDWDGDPSTRSTTTEGTLTLTADDSDENVIETLNVNAVVASKFALDSQITQLNVAGSAAVNIQLDANIDEAGKWILENEEGTDVVTQQFVLLNTDFNANNPVSPMNRKYWTTTDGAALEADEGNALTAETASVLTAVAKPDDKEDSQTNWITESIESIMVSGEAGLTVDARGQEDLTSVDLSASSGKNSVTLTATNDLTSVNGGSGNDKVTIKEGDLAATGLMVDLGAGDDTYVTGAAKNPVAVAANSMIDGGEGSDTLAMANGANSTAHTYTEDGEAKTIYTGFETLDVGGGSGDYDMAILGIGTLQVTKGTGGTVTLNNVTAGTAINASGNSGAAGNSHTMATIAYNLAEREAGSFVFGSNGVLDVNLRAVGRFNDKGDDSDTRAYDPTINVVASQVALILTADADTNGMMIDSSASAGGTALASDYHNIACVDATNLVNVRITGDARLTFKAVATDPMDPSTRTVTALDAIEYIDASSNTGGVYVQVFDAAGRTTDVNGTDVQRTTLLGGSAADTLSGSQATGVTNVLRGNGGNDKLNGGDGDDIFIGGAGADTMNQGVNTDGMEGFGGDDQFYYYAASDSQVTFFGEVAARTDVIHNFGTGDSIRLHSSLLANGNNKVKSAAVGSAGATFVINGFDTDNDTANSLRLLIGDGDGFFGTENGLSFDKNFMAVVVDTYWMDDGNEVRDAAEEMQRTWVLFDIDGDGDFDAGTDMVIQLAGTAVAVDAIVSVGAI